MHVCFGLVCVVFTFMGYLLDILFIFNNVNYHISSLLMGVDEVHDYIVSQRMMHEHPLFEDSSYERNFGKVGYKFKIRIRSKISFDEFPIS